MNPFLSYPRHINNTLKMQKTFFCKSSDIANKMLVIIHANKINAKNKVLIQNLEPLALKPIKTKGHLTMYLHQFIQR
jgi:hypothetical protein